MTRGRIRIAFLLLFFAAAGILYSHGAEYEVLQTGGVLIRALYDTGEPFAGSDVLVFAPGETEASFKTASDKDGIFYFLADKKGTWIIQVRGEGGHGLRINIDIDESMMFSDSDRSGSSMTLFQKILIAICVVWGFTGTFLFFRRKRSS